MDANRTEQTQTQVVKEKETLPTCSFCGRAFHMLANLINPLGFSQWTTWLRHTLFTWADNELHSGSRQPVLCSLFYNSVSVAEKNSQWTLSNSSGREGLLNSRPITVGGSSHKQFSLDKKVLDLWSSRRSPLGRKYCQWSCPLSHHITLCHFLPLFCLWVDQILCVCVLHTCVCICLCQGLCLSFYIYALMEM